MPLMLLSEALETLRMVSGRLKGDDYKKEIPSVSDAQMGFDAERKV